MSNQGLARAFGHPLDRLTPLRAPAQRPADKAIRNRASKNERAYPSGKGADQHAVTSLRPWGTALSPILASSRDSRNRQQQYRLRIRRQDLGIGDPR